MSRCQRRDLHTTSSTTAKRTEPSTTLGAWSGMLLKNIILKTRILNYLAMENKLFNGKTCLMLRARVVNYLVLIFTVEQ